MDARNKSAHDDKGESCRELQNNASDIVLCLIRKVAGSFQGSVQQFCHWVENTALPSAAGAALSELGRGEHGHGEDEARPARLRADFQRIGRH